MNEIEYVTLYKRIFKLIPSEEIAKTILMEMGKDRRGQEANRNKNQVQKESPATEKQKNTLTKFGISYNPNITKKEAIKLIGEAIKKINLDKISTDIP